MKTILKIIAVMALAVSAAGQEINAGDDVGITNIGGGLVSRGSIPLSEIQKINPARATNTVAITGELRLMLEYKLETRVSTNWTTVSRTVPVVAPSDIVLVVARVDLLNQVGTVTTNTVLKFEYQGRPFEVVVGSTNSPERLTRSIIEKGAR